LNFKRYTLNYLAHIFLSSTPQMQVGNFIGDFVKGNRLERYPAEVREGILLHRAIDRFTDTHPVVQRTKGLLREPFGRYAGVLLDMYFDHLLAVHFSAFSPVRLNTFAWKFYRTLWRHRRILPEEVHGFLWHFILSNRLCRYATIDGLRGSLAIMVRYHPFPVDVRQAIAFLQEHYDLLHTNFSLFFPEVMAFGETHVNTVLRAGTASTTDARP
jgi:acyl carrier protein phosphodiesterase